MIIEKFQNRLQMLGYQQVSMQPQEIHVYYQKNGSNMTVVLCMEERQDFHLDAEQVASLQDKIQRIFRHPAGKIPGFTPEMEPFDVEAILVVFSADINRVRELSQKNSNTWLVDEVHDRLVLFENQPSEFHGLRKELEALEPLAYKSSEPYAGSSSYGGRTGRANNNQTRATEHGTQDWHQLELVTILLVASNIVTYIILELLGDTTDALFMLDHGAMYPNFIFYNDQWYRFFTSMFLHFGPAHLVNNMLMLFLLGRELEKALGKLRYLIVYLGAGVGGSILSFAMAIRQNDMIVSAGASGAIFGIVGGLLAVILVHKGRYQYFTAKRMIFMAALSLYFGFTSSNVDNYCHVGGLVCGFVLTLVCYGIPYLTKQNH